MEDRRGQHEPQGWGQAGRELEPWACTCPGERLWAPCLGEEADSSNRRARPPAPLPWGEEDTPSGHCPGRYPAGQVPCRHWLQPPRQAGREPGWRPL